MPVMATGGTIGRAGRCRRGIWYHFASLSALRTDSSCCGQKFLDANEIIGARGENEEPLHQPAAAMAGLAQAADRLHPTEAFLDALAFDRADAIAGMPGGARVDCRAAVGVVLRDVRRAYTHSIRRINHGLACPSTSDYEAPSGPRPTRHSLSNPRFADAVLLSSKRSVHHCLREVSSPHNRKDLCTCPKS